LGSFKFVPNRGGFVALRNSREVQSMCLTHAQSIASRAESIAHGHKSGRGATFSADVQAGRTRCHAMAKQHGGYGRGGPLMQARGF